MGSPIIGIDGLYDGLLSLPALGAEILRPNEYGMFYTAATSAWYSFGFYVGFVIQAGLLFFGGLKAVSKF